VYVLQMVLVVCGVPVQPFRFPAAKTAQPHVASAYRKVGVANRVSAAMWLAERGLLGR
jgi:hypothetical protein